MTPEGRVKRDIKAELERAGFWQAGHPEPATVTGWFYMPVNNGMGVSGIPDFLGVETLRITPDMVGMKFGRFFSIEAKAPGRMSNVTELQKDRHREIRAAGGVVLVADDVSILEEHLYGRKTI